MPVVFGTHVRQFVLLPVRPDVFDWVQLRGISRQNLDLNAPLESREIVPN